MHAFRARNGPEAQPITWDQIAAFDRLHRLDMDPFELELVELLELAYRQHAAGNAPAPDDEDTDDLTE